MGFPRPWNAETGGSWGMSPAYDQPEHAGFSRRITYRCMFCHNAYPPLGPEVDDSEDGSRYPAKLPQGIDCQRCHGPGSNHVDAARRGLPVQTIRPEIVNPAPLSPDRRTYGTHQ